MDVEADKVTFMRDNFMGKNVTLGIFGVECWGFLGWVLWGWGGRLEGIGGLVCDLMKIIFKVYTEYK